MLIETHTLTPSTVLPPEVKHQTYCGLDSAILPEIRSVLQPQLATSPQAQIIYDFERALQAPYLEMMLRGFAVNQSARSGAASRLRERIAALQLTLNRLASAAWDNPLNPRSSDQLKRFFYGHLRLPEVHVSFRGVRRVSANREALEKLHERYLHSRPFVNCILSIRDLSKQLEVFETDIDSDGRFRASYNIAGTETGRPSSSENAFGTGGNAQNIAPSLRYVFVADPGYKLCVIDYEQVEARDVGWFCGCLFNDWSFLDACESGDLHTANARRIWPELEWTGNFTQDRTRAETKFYRDFSYRDMAKRGSHASNYMGTANTASRALKVPLELMKNFQDRYCRGANAAYPCIPRYWQWCAAEIQQKHYLVTPFGRKRHFFGRPDDDATVREAIAFMPQSTTADRTNLGLWRVWRRMPQIQLLAQTYDSITFQYPESQDESKIVGRALELLKVEFIHPSGRVYVVPGEAKVGWNWGNASDKNPSGLAKWSPSKPDTRVRPTIMGGIN